MRFRVLLAPDTVKVNEALVPLTSTLPSFIHTTSGTTTSPSTTFTVHTSEYTDPAIELPDDAVTTGGGRAGDKRKDKYHINGHLTHPHLGQPMIYLLKH